MYANFSVNINKSIYKLQNLIFVKGGCIVQCGLAGDVAMWWRGRDFVCQVQFVVPQYHPRSDER